MTNIYWPSDIKIIKNRYYFAYLQLILRAKVRDYQKLNYYEKHHIIPRCLGGRDTKANFAYLTAKEHYLAHRFLTRFTTNNIQYKMLYALDAMGMKSKDTKQRWRMPARVYQYNKLQISLRGHSEETKLKIGLANKGRSPANKGIPRSEETRRKISISRIGKKGAPASNKTKEIASKWHGNSIWIYNNCSRKKIQLEELHDYLNLGWKKGRGKCKTPTIVCRKEFSIEEKQKRSIFVSQLVWICNKNLQKRLRVPKEQLNYYLNNGWLLGKTL